MKNTSNIEGVSISWRDPNIVHCDPVYGKWSEYCPGSPYLKARDLLISKKVIRICAVTLIECNYAADVEYYITLLRLIFLDVLKIILK
jgi:hypothetical protein